ncbi:MAG TPA: SGNH/GDSL hydrolase family protein, partial [Terrimicrobiaceae bacterium]|nr:SGNH/GDSL hydrolase family protein [Terrimicrobiaceae bacterium]
MHIPHDDPRISWHGHISLERTTSFTRPWRIPWADRMLHHVGLVEKAANPAGVRLAFHSTTRHLGGKILSTENNQFLDLLVDGQPFATQNLAGTESFAFTDLPADGKLIELWLPQAGDFALRHLEIEEGSAISPYIDTRPRWITYGSSITQCRAAESPSQTWPALVARARGQNLCCLGFGGQCHLDSLI